MTLGQIVLTNILKRPKLGKLVDSWSTENLCISQCSTLGLI